MKRRDLFLLSAATLLCPFPAGAADPAGKRRIAVLYYGTAATNAGVRAFVDELEKLGWIDGRNVTLDVRYSEGRTERFPDLAADVVKHKPDLIVAMSTPATQAAKAAAGDIPIVMASVSDPVGSKIVSSLAHPGGNVTGLSLLAPELSVKRVDILKQAVPSLTRLGVLWNLQNDGMQLRFREINAAAPALGIQILSFGVRNPEEFDEAFIAMAREHLQALLVMADPVTLGQRERTVEFARSHRIPTIYEAREFVDAGGLLSYGISLPAHYRRAAIYVDRILKGAKPADLPVEQPTQFELVINLKTARALGLAISQSLLLRADQVID
jgi:putative tryptophan/tyrosine transport system substrate-binding protein